MSAKEYGLLIDGAWVTPPNASRFTTHSPTNGEAVGSFVAATPSDARRAIDAAERAFPKWRAVPPPYRGRYLARAAEILRERKEALGAIVTREMGKVIAEGRGDVQEAIDFVE